MLTLQSETPQNKSTNYKLVLGAIASTAVICASSVYFVQQKHSSSTGTDLLSMFPEEYSGNLSLTDTNKFSKGTYSMNINFNKWNDENGEWTVEGEALEQDKKRGRVRRYFLKDDYFTVRTSRGKNNTYDCLPEYKHLGYATYKRSLLSAVEVEKKDLHSNVVGELNEICPQDAKYAILENEDVGTLVMCAKTEKSGVVAGIVGHDFRGVFKTLPEKTNIVLPKEEKGDYNLVGIEMMDNECKKADKFQSAETYQLKENAKVAKKFHLLNVDKIDNFPFTTFDEEIEIENQRWSRELRGRSKVAFSREIEIIPEKFTVKGKALGEGNHFAKILGGPGGYLGGGGKGDPTHQPVFSPIRQPVGELTDDFKGPTPAPTPGALQQNHKGPPPVRNGIYCYWLHGAGNHRGFKRANLNDKHGNFYGKKAGHETQYYRSKLCNTNFVDNYIGNDEESCLGMLESVLRTNQDTYNDNFQILADEYNYMPNVIGTLDNIQENALDALTSGIAYDDVLFMTMASGVTHPLRYRGDYWNGSACLYRNKQQPGLDAKDLKKGDQVADSYYKYPRCEESFYPYFINGGVHYKSGVLGQLCKRGLYWSTNTGNFGANSLELVIRYSIFVCGSFGCTFGPDTGKGFPLPNWDPEGITDKTSVLFGHSYGCVATYAAFHSGYIVKGPRGFIGLSQGPVRGSSAAQFSQFSCHMDFWPGTNDNWTYLKKLAIRELNKIFQTVSRGIGYCEHWDGNDYSPSSHQMGKAKDVWFPAMAHVLHWGRDYETNVSSAFWNQDWAIEYKYCGTKPAGMYYDYIGSIPAAMPSIPNFQQIMDFVEQFTGSSGSYPNIAGMSAPDVNIVNSLMLTGLAIAPCLLFNSCQQMHCVIDTQLDCTYRGCRNKSSARNLNTMEVSSVFNIIMDFVLTTNIVYTISSNITLPVAFNFNGAPDCRHERVKDWAAGNFEFSTDGMVNLNSCIGTDWGDQYQEPGSGGAVGDAGDSLIAIQASNHEDGTGTNGNSWTQHRKPINWYMYVVRQAHYYQTTERWNQCRTGLGCNSYLTPVQTSWQYKYGLELVHDGFIGFVDTSKFDNSYTHNQYNADTWGGPGTGPPPGGGGPGGATGGGGSGPQGGWN